jgi:hypothetical protein
MIYPTRAFLRGKIGLIVVEGLRMRLCDASDVKRSGTYTSNIHVQHARADCVVICTLRVL